MQLKIKKLHQDAVVPKYATDGAAAFDLCALHAGHTLLGKTATVRTGLAFEIPEGYVMLVFSRSGHGFNCDVRLSNCVGVIDSDYRGEVQVKLATDVKGIGLNFSAGDRIAQAMIVPIVTVDFIVSEELTETVRGEAGFGSTGAN
jgi:dUTP pyrophosphatase